MADRIGLADELQKLRHAAAHETIAGRIGDCTIGQNGRNLLAWVYENAGSLEAILRANTDPSLERVEAMREAAERVCHAEQMTVWSGEVTGILSMGGYLREDLDYDEVAGLHSAVAREIKRIVAGAFAHPELVASDDNSGALPVPNEGAERC